MSQACERLALLRTGTVPVERLPAVVAQEELPADHALGEGGEEAGALREVPHPGHVLLGSQNFYKIYLFK
jgi:hypothetical protein